MKNFCIKPWENPSQPIFNFYMDVFKQNGDKTIDFFLEGIPWLTSDREYEEAASSGKLGFLYQMHNYFNKYYGRHAKSKILKHRIHWTDIRFHLEIVKQKSQPIVPRHVHDQITQRAHLGKATFDDADVTENVLGLDLWYCNRKFHKECHDGADPQIVWKSGYNTMYKHLITELLGRLFPSVALEQITWHDMAQRCCQHAKILYDQYYINKQVMKLPEDFTQAVLRFEAEQIEAITGRYEAERLHEELSPGVLRSLENLGFVAIFHLRSFASDINFDLPSRLMDVYTVGRMLKKFHHSASTRGDQNEARHIMYHSGAFHSANIADFLSTIGYIAGPRITGEESCSKISMEASTLFDPDI